MSVQFDGVDDAIKTATVAGMPTGYPVSIAALVRLSNLASDNPLAQVGQGPFGTPNGYYLTTIQTTGQLRWYEPVSQANVDTVGVVPASAWLFIGVTGISSTSTYCYAYNYDTKRALLEETLGGVGALTTPTLTTKIGARAPTNDSTLTVFFNGIMGWIAFYALDLSVSSGARMKRLRDFGPFDAAPSSVYLFKEGSGTTTANSLVSNDGTLQGFNFNSASGWREWPAFLSKFSRAQPIRPRIFKPGNAR